MHSFDVLEEAGELTRRGQPFALATVVWRQGPSSGQQGSRAIITASGELHGWIGGGCAGPPRVPRGRPGSSGGPPRPPALGRPGAFSRTGGAGRGVGGAPCLPS